MQISKEAIEEAMCEKGIFPGDICNRAGITKAVFDQIISGEAVERLTASKIAVALGVTVQDILKNEIQT